MIRTDPVGQNNSPSHSLPVTVPQACKSTTKDTVMTFNLCLTTESTRSGPLTTSKRYLLPAAEEDDHLGMFSRLHQSSEWDGSDNQTNADESCHAPTLPVRRPPADPQQIPPRQPTADHQSTSPPRWPCKVMPNTSRRDLSDRWQRRRRSG